MSLGEFLPSSSTKGYWKLNGDSSDSSGNGQNGTDTNITYGTAYGKFGQGALFNGSSSLIRNTTAGSMPTGSTARTVSAWVYCNSGTTNYKGIFDYGTNATRKRFGLSLNNSNPGKYAVYAYDDDYVSSNSITLNKWTNIIYTYDGNVTGKMYVNGFLDGTKTYASSLNTTISATGLTIGHDNTTGNFWPGYIDEVIIENRAWSATEVQKYYTASLGRFGT